MNAFGKTIVALCCISGLSVGVVADPVPGPYFSAHDQNYLPRRYFSATICCLVKNEVGQPFRGAWIDINYTHLDIPKGYELIDDDMARCYVTDKHGQCEIKNNYRELILWV